VRAVFLALGPAIVGAMMSKGMAGMPGPMVAMVLQLGGIFFVVYGLVALAVSYGLWVGKSWAWWIYLILMILGVVLSLPALPESIVGIAINAIIIYYLTRPHVKQYFGV